MIDINKLQEDFKVWQDNNFGPQPPYRMILGMAEELGELCHSKLKSEQGIRDNENHEELMKDAVGDIFIYMTNFCNCMGYNLEDIIKEVSIQVLKRDWTKNKENGNVN